MFCPECRQEYSPGATLCAECGVALVESLPPDPEAEVVEWTDLVTVLVSADSAALLVAESMLRAAGIEFLARGDYLQEFIGWGRLLPLGINLITGPVEIQVRPEDVEAAREVLREPTHALLASDDAAAEEA